MLYYKLGSSNCLCMPHLSSYEDITNSIIIYVHIYVQYYIYNDFCNTINSGLKKNTIIETALKHREMKKKNLYSIRIVCISIFLTS